MFEHRAALAVAALAAGTLAIWTVTATAQHSARAATTVNVIAGKPTEYKFALSAKSVPMGAVTFKISDKGTTPHDFKVCASPKASTATSCTGKAAPTVSPGGTSTLKVTFTKPGSYEYLCTLPGHAALGMKGILKVT